MSKPSDLFPAAYFVAYPSACSAGTKTKVGERDYDHKKSRARFEHRREAWRVLRRQSYDDVLHNPNFSAK